VAGDEQGVVRIFDLAKKEREKGDWPLFQGAVGDLGVTPDKKLLAAIDQKGVLKVADVAKREVLGSVTAHTGGVRGLLVSPKGDTVLTLGADREVKAWSLADPTQLKPVRTWKLPAGVNGAAFAPDGKAVVTANADGTAYVLELP
jgi:WD40 repeat protein